MHDLPSAGHAGSKTLHQQNPTVLNRERQLTQDDLYTTTILRSFVWDYPDELVPE